jgi:signal transduction histidine kinase
MERALQDLHKRVDELEQLVATLRHDVNGALTPALLMADQLRTHADPAAQRAGERIGQAIVRVTKLLRDSRDIVPPRAAAP